MNNFSANSQWLEGGVWQSGQGRGGLYCVSAMCQPVYNIVDHWWNGGGKSEN